MKVTFRYKIGALILAIAVAGTLFFFGAKPDETPQTVKAAENNISGGISFEEHKDLFGDSYRAANDAYNAKHGFDPLSGKVVTVDTYSSTTSSANQWGYGFVEAYQDEDVTKIIMLNDISSPTSGSGNIGKRKNSIEIDGGGYKLLLYRRNLSIAEPTSGTQSVFHMHDLTAAQSTDYSGSGGSEAAYRKSLIRGDNGIHGDGDVSKNWYFRFGNVFTDYDPAKYEGENENYSTFVGRWARVNQSEVTMYGYNILVTGAENFYTGSIVVEDNTVWKGTNCGQNYSVVWFTTRQLDGSTGLSGEFTIGKNAFVYLRNTTGGTTYPAIYDNYSTITVGEGSYYNANMQGRAISNYDATELNNRYPSKKFIAKENSHVNLLSRGNGSVVKLDYNNSSVNSDMTFTAEKNSEVFIYGSTTDGVISMAGNGSLFELDTPKMFEIRNSNTRSFLNISNNNIFRIKDTDINTWKNATALTNPADFVYEKVGHLTAAGPTVTSSNSDLQTSFTSNGFRRINGLNVPPKVVWDYVTDAEKSYRARVSLGLIPTGQFDSNGVAIMTESWALPGQAVVSLKDTYGNIRGPLALQSDGYVKYTDTEFQKATFDMEGTATRGITWTGDVGKTTVIDVTPPTPISLTKGKITTTDKSLSATGVEPNAKVYLSVNDGPLTAVGTANAAGEWSHQLGSAFAKDTKVQIYLEDNAADYPANFNSTGLESTHIASGNRNPKTDVTYKDATFKAATTYIVEQATVKLHIRQMAVASAADREILTTPTEGYLTIENTDTIKYNTHVNSGYELTDAADNDQVDFNSIVIELVDADTYSKLKFKPIIPGYYQNQGYIVSDTAEKPSITTHTVQPGEYEYDFNDGVYEKWLTIYIKPNQTDIKPYNWDYKVNDIGTIKIP
ncbi:pectate lyase-like adhesive domain-containing protein [Enterococcus sp. AZ072]|uniref:pectate lyase-like adhesive domain-containing protein n=1 Tax=unclassified Enterococcus TaxID=2608891 RepID=UPI003D2D1F2D